MNFQGDQTLLHGMLAGRPPNSPAERAPPRLPSDRGILASKPAAGGEEFVHRRKRFRYLDDEKETRGTYNNNTRDGGLGLRARGSVYALPGREVRGLAPREAAIRKPRPGEVGVEPLPLAAALPDPAGGCPAAPRAAGGLTGVE